MVTVKDFLQNIQATPVPRKIKKAAQKLTLALQATESQRSAADILNWSPQTAQRTVRKNNFKDYASQVRELDEMYHARTDYGAHLARGAIDIRTAFIGGEGISVTGGAKKSTREWIHDFLDTNGLSGAKIIEAMVRCEIEGKALCIIKKTGGELGPESVKIRTKFVNYRKTEYKVEANEFGDAEKVTWKGADGKDKSETAENFEYLHYCAYDDNVNNTPPPAANVIQQIINYDRALYDLRENNHIFGKTTPVITGKDNEAIANAISYINANNWKIGRALPLAGDLKFPGPPQTSLDLIKGEMSLNLKIVTSVLGVPVHWLGWTDLMSNRATADTLAELVETATKLIRLKWVSFITNIVRKAMVKSQKFGAGEKDLYGFKIDLPQITAEKIKELIEAWFILAEAGYVARSVLINKLPGVDPEENQKELERERKKNEETKPRAARDFEDALEKTEDEENQE